MLKRFLECLAKIGKGIMHRDPGHDSDKDSFILPGGEGGVQNLIYPDAAGEGHFHAPSLVGFTPDGQEVCGWQAKPWQAVVPEYAFDKFKRNLGRNESMGLGPNGQDITPQHCMSKMGEYTIATFKDQFPGYDLLDSGIWVHSATTPVVASDSQKTRTLEACREASIHVPYLYAEPTAAAMAVFAEMMPFNARAAVYDCGGGTFDISILEISTSDIQVIDSHCHDHLGGKDITRSIAGWLQDVLMKTCDIQMDWDDPVRRFYLEEWAEQIKIGVGTQKEFQFTCEIDTEQHTIPVNRDEINEAVSDVVQASHDLVAKSLAGDNIDISSVEHVLLAGDGSRFPAIEQDIIEQVSRQIPGANIIRPTDRKTLIARGGAILTLFNVVREEGLLPANGGWLPRPPKLREQIHNSLSIVIETINQSAEEHLIAAEVVAAHTEIPCEVTRTFDLAEDNADAFRLSLVQEPEGAVISDDTHLIHSYDVEELPPGPAGPDRIAVSLGYDRNGVISVKVQDTQSDFVRDFSYSYGCPIDG